jgi:hypothetical protein
MGVRLQFMDEFEGKMLIAVRQYELINKTAQPNSLLIKHWRGQAEMYAAAIIALRASGEEHDYNYSGGI